MQTVINISSNFFAQILVAILSFAFIPFYLEQLGASAYGIVGLFSIAQALFSLLDVGIGHFLTKELLSNSNKLAIYRLANNLLRSFAFLFVVLAIILFLVSDFLHFYVTSPDYFISKGYLRSLLFVMALLLGLKSIDSFYRAILYGLNRQVQYNLALSAASIAKVVGLLIILPLVRSHNLVFFFGWQLLCILSLVLFLKVRVSRYMGAFKASYLDKSTFHRRGLLVQFAGGVSLFSLLALIYTQLDKLVVANITSLASFGLYSFVSVAAASISYFAVPVMQAVYPLFCAESAAENKKGLLKIFRKSTQLVGCLVVTSSTIGILFSKEILFLWTQSSELSSTISTNFSLLLLANTCISLSLLPNYLLIATEEISRLKNQMFLQVAFLLLMLLYFVPRMGQAGAAISLLTVSCDYLFLVLPFNLKFSNLRNIRKLFYLDLARILLIALAGTSTARLISFGWSAPYFLYLPLVFILTLTFSIYSCPYLRSDLTSSLKCIKF